MENNLLINLRKYRPRDNTNPLENFITEAFAHLLRSSHKITQALVTKINAGLDMPLNVVSENYSVSTQENFNNKFPDMVIKWQDTALVFEHKVYSELHNNQLENYRKFAQEHYALSRIVLITARRYQHKQNPDYAFCWHDIFEFLQKEVSTELENDKISWYLQEFLELLQAEGLGPVAPINAIAIAHYREAKALEEQMQSLLNRAASEHTQWPIGSILQPAFKDRSRAVEKRLGVEFCRINEKQERKWAPGLFCGFILDGRDHNFDSVMGERLHVAVIFDFNKSAHEILRSSQSFKGLRQTLHKAIEILNQSVDILKGRRQGWTVIDNQGADTVSGVNWYHPLAIVQPMDDFFADHQTIETQLDCFVQQISQIQKLLLECPEFTHLLEELSC